jgi:hypothetical protein
MEKWSPLSLKHVKGEKTAVKDFVYFSVKGTKLATAVCDFKFWLQYFFMLVPWS